MKHVQIIKERAVHPKRLYRKGADYGRQQNLTRCAACGAVAPRLLGTPATKIADKAQAGRLFCALPRVAYGTFRLTAKRRVNSAL